MPTYFCRLNPPRATFMQDITAAEMTIMQQHAAYWNTAMKKGKVVVFGFVANPAGPFGVGILEVNSEDELRKMTNNDPTITMGEGFTYDVFPMPRGAIHPEFAPSTS